MQTAVYEAFNTESKKNVFWLILERGADISVIADRAALSVLPKPCYCCHGMAYLRDLLDEGANPAVQPS